MTESKGISSTVGIMLLVALVIIMFSLSAFILFTNLGTSNENPSPSSVDTQVEFQMQNDKLLVTPTKFEEPVKVKADGNPVGTIESPADTVVVNLDKNQGTNIKIYTLQEKPVLTQQLLDVTPDNTGNIDLTISNQPNRVVGTVETFSLNNDYSTITWSATNGAVIKDGKNEKTMKVKYKQPGTTTIQVEVTKNGNQVTADQTVNVESSGISISSGLKIQGYPTRTQNTWETFTLNKEVYDNVDWTVNNAMTLSTSDKYSIKVGYKNTGTVDITVEAYNNSESPKTRTKTVQVEAETYENLKIKEKTKTYKKSVTFDQLDDPSFYNYISYGPNTNYDSLIYRTFSRVDTITIDFKPNYVDADQTSVNRPYMNIGPNVDDSDVDSTGSNKILGNKFTVPASEITGSSKDGTVSWMIGDETLSSDTMTMYYTGDSETRSVSTTESALSPLVSKDVESTSYDIYVGVHPTDTNIDSSGGLYGGTANETENGCTYAEKDTTSSAIADIYIKDDCKDYIENYITSNPGKEISTAIKTSGKVLGG